MALRKNPHTSVPKDNLLDKALTLTRESKFIEFKEAFDVSSTRDWCEIIKDIVALANTGGGMIVLGVDNRGNPTGFNIRSILQLDPADVTNKIYSYTNCQFADFEISEQTKRRRKVACVRVNGVAIPMVFTRPGTYDVGGGKQKSAFSAGTIYFRHGAKSEPGNTEDIRRTIERQQDSIRKEWVRGVRRVVAAPKGSRVLVLPTQLGVPSSLATSSLRVSNDPTAPVVRLTREKDQATGVFLHEELSDGLFDEIDNVLNANSILARGVEKFLLGSQVYFRIYAERQHIRASPDQLRLLALTGLQDIYGPTLYWLLQLPAGQLASILRPMCEDPKTPNVYTAMRIGILLGAQARKWLFDLWAKKWPYEGQHPDFFWTMKKIASRNEVKNRRLTALRTMSGLSDEFSDGPNRNTMDELLALPRLASSYLSRACVRVFEGNKDARSLCRQLDILAYGQEFESRSEEIFDALIAS